MWSNGAEEIYERPRKVADMSSLPSSRGHKTQETSDSRNSRKRQNDRDKSKNRSQSTEDEANEEEKASEEENLLHFDEAQEASQVPTQEKLIQSGRNPKIPHLKAIIKVIIPPIMLVVPIIISCKRIYLFVNVSTV